MNELINTLRSFFRGLQLWIIVAPWEQGLRVRFGKRVKLLNAGVHLRLPFVDAIYVQSVRMRASMLGRQTVSCKDGRPVTFAGAIGYSIADMEVLYGAVHHAEDTLRNLARAGIAEFITKSALEECTHDAINSHVQETINFAAMGLGQVRIYLTDFAAVRAYRLIGDAGEYMWGSGLATDQAVGAAKP